MCAASNKIVFPVTVGAGTGYVLLPQPIHIALSSREHPRERPADLVRKSFALDYLRRPGPGTQPGESGIHEVGARNTPNTSADGIAALLLTPQVWKCGRLYLNWLVAFDECSWQKVYGTLILVAMGKWKLLH